MTLVPKLLVTQLLAHPVACMQRVGWVSAQPQPGICLHCKAAPLQAPAKSWSDYVEQMPLPFLLGQGMG